MEERSVPVADIDHQVYVVIGSLLKRWLLGTHQGAVSGKHLDYYLDKHTFRFNRRTSGSRGILFYPLMETEVMTVLLPYRQVVDGNHTM